jgi:hypothetical protein
VVLSVGGFVHSLDGPLRDFQGAVPILGHSRRLMPGFGEVGLVQTPLLMADA